MQFSPLRALFFPLAGLALVLAAPSGLAQGPATDSIPTETAGKALRALLDDFLAGASVNDRRTHEGFWSEGLIYTSSSGLRFGKATILTGLEEAPPIAPDAPVYSAAEVEVQDFGETAVVTFRLLAHRGGELADQYFNTGVFHRHDGRWQAVTWQATRIPEGGDD